MFTIEAIAIRCTVSLRTIDNHFGLRRVIPLYPSRTLTALGMTPSLPTCLVGCPATVGVRETVGSVVLCCTCVLLPTVAVRLTLGSIALRVHGLCRRAALSSLSGSLHWPLRPLPPASGDQSSPCPDLTSTQCVALARCMDSLVVTMRLFSHALHHVVLRCHDDRVEDGFAQ